MSKAAAHDDEAARKQKLDNDKLETPKVEHVLLVRARSGSTQRLLDDRPLFFQDKFSTVASAGITYLLIDTEFSRVITGGSRSASRAMSGSIGGQFHLGPVQGAS